VARRGSSHFRAAKLAGALGSTDRYANAGGATARIHRAEVARSTFSGGSARWGCRAERIAATHTGAFGSGIALAVRCWVALR